MKELFKPIKGYEDRYVISPSGVVMRIERKVTDRKGRSYRITGKPIVQHINPRSGYPCVVLRSATGKRGSQYVHRLVALTFLPGIPGKDFVNHKNGNKKDCRLENLEWVTFRENWLHALKMKLAFPAGKNKVKVVDICKEKEYPSMKVAAMEYNLPYNRIRTLFRKGEIPCGCLKRA